MPIPSAISVEFQTSLLVLDHSASLLDARPSLMTSVAALPMGLLAPAFYAGELGVCRSRSPCRACPPRHCAMLRPWGISPNYPGSGVRPSIAAHCPGWEEAPERVSDGDLFGQPEPDFAFDKRRAW